MRRFAPLVVALLAALPGVAGAQQSPPASQPGPQPGPAEVTLDEIVVSGSADDDPTQNVRSIDRREIQRHHDRTAVEALEREPAIFASTGRRGERIFTLRGFDQRQIVVLLDGAPAYIPYDGQVDLGLLPAELIDHITVVKGPASVLLGPNGMGGAVNIVTRRPGSAPLLSLSVENGTANAWQVSGIHSASRGRFGYTLYAGWRHRDTFPLSRDFVPVSRENGVLRDNSDRSQAHVGGNLEVRLRGSHRLTGSVAYVDGDQGIPPGLLDPVIRFWRFTVWRSLAASLGHAADYAGRRLQIDELLYARTYDNLLDGYDDATYTTQATYRALHSWYHDQLFGGRVRGRLRLPLSPRVSSELRLWAGLQHDRHQEEQGGVPLPAPITRSLVTIAPEAEAFLGERWTLLAGLQTDIEVPGSTPSGSLASRRSLGPMVAAGFDPLPSLSLRATVARRTRFPTLRDRFSLAFGSRVPNPDLGPESAWHFGLSAQWRGPAGLLVDASVYDAEVTGLIDIANIGGGLQQMQNLPVGARLLGFELSTTARPLRWLQLRAGYAFLRARRTEPFGGSDELQYRPAHKLTAEAILTWRWVELLTTVRFVGPRTYQHPATDEWRSLAAYAIWDAGLAVHPSPWAAVWLRATNLLDSNIDSEAGFPEPGRQIWVGLRLSYDGALRRPRPAR